MPPPSRQDLWSAGQDETVQVNQRALIDKILARYSGEHTIFRELLQNADDAGAEHVQVKFYTQAGVEAHENGTLPPALPDPKKQPLVRYVVANDGIPFRPEDWNRLKKIAEGNPDEEKIGAFGVGFYSLWSVCDDPFVESGSKWMGFYWKDGKDQLLARSGDLPPSSGSQALSSNGNPWTTFTMVLRDPTPFEEPLEFARFLVTSLTFMRTIKRVDMMVDDIKVLEVRKDITGQSKVSKSGLSTTSAAGMMNVYGVDATSMVITARVMKWLSATGVTPKPLPAPVIQKPTGFLASFFSRSAPVAPPIAPSPPPAPESPTEVDVLAREIHTYQADIKVTVSSQFARELERATKKSPPSRMPASLVFSHQDESATTVDGGSVVDKKAGAVFAGLCPPLDGEQSARVFIGQPTSQTTGIGGHMAARFIPTVERESIDLVDRHVSHWNKELLWVGGYLSRLIYELQMVDLAEQWSKTVASDVMIRSQILSRALYVLRFFTYRPTTPSPTVGKEMESAFYQCARNNSKMPLLSTTGILPVDQIRIPNDQLLAFLPELPVLTPATVTDAKMAVVRLRERNVLREIMFDDVVKQLGARPLSEKEMVACLGWWQDIAAVEGYTQTVRSQLANATVLVTSSDKVIPLSAVKTYINPQGTSIPTDMPAPLDTIPYAVTKELKGATIHKIFGWTELSLPHYVQFLASPPMSGGRDCNPETDIRVSPIFAERMLTMIGRAWQSISATQQNAIVTLLKDVACIPTRAGFKVPGEAYFEKNLLFDDLPTIALPKVQVIKGGLDKMLLAIGVRRTVDLQLVFSRLIGGGEWTCVDLMKYLVSVKDTLTQDELARLRQTAAFPLERPLQPDGSKQPIVRKKPLELYEPTESMRQMHLPRLDWGDQKWRSNSDEAKMLFELGLRRHPPTEVLVAVASSTAPAREYALTFLLDNRYSIYPNFNLSDHKTMSFIPAKSPDGQQIFATPGDVFTNPLCAILGYNVTRGLSPEDCTKLQIPSDPPMEKLVSSLLAMSVMDIDKARTIFEYFSTRLGTSSMSALSPLSVRPFIPVEQKVDDVKRKMRLARPDEVYFVSKDSAQSLYASAFTFIDFGEKANFFLRQCGVKSEPSHKDVARLLLRDPERMLRTAGSPQRYLDQLRVLAANFSTFDRTLIAELKASSFLLASQMVPVKKSKGKWGGGAVEEELEREWVLCQASDAVIVDDSTYYQFFCKYTLAAPEEQMLERFYQQLGAQKISSRVRVEYSHAAVRPGSSSNAAATRKHVLERLTIWLAQTSRKGDTEYTAEWLANGDHFVVQEANNIMAKYMYRHGRQSHDHVETLYAIANKSAVSRQVVLVTSMSAAPDYYDIAVALCKTLLKKHRADDVIVLDSILSTPLMALKKRGFNVDRILNQQNEERLRLRAEAARDSEKAAAEAANAKLTAEAGAGAIAAGAAGRDEQRTQAGTSWTAPGGSGGGVTGGLGSLSGGQSIVDMVKRLGVSGPSKGSWGTRSGSNNGHGHQNGGIGHQVQSKGPAVTQSTGTTQPGEARPSSPSEISRLVKSAVQASRPHNGNTVGGSTAEIPDVAEGQSTYCDSKADANLKLFMDAGANMYKLWISNDMAGLDQTQLDVCHVFVRDILKPIGRVYDLQFGAINVFWDLGSTLIAFNNGNTLYCNARYFYAWHYHDVVRGKLNEAFISWYFTLAHEIAHNLESAHNSKHEFYFSSIAEEYLVKFVQLLGAQSGVPH